MTDSNYAKPLERQLRSLYPDCEPIAAFSAALPLYRVRIAAKVLVPQPLSVIAQFMLRAIALGQNTPRALAELFGIGERDVNDACADLLQVGLIDLGQADATGRRALAITNNGNAWIVAKAPTAAAQKRWIDLHYDPLGERLLPKQDAARRVPRKHDKDIFVLPHTGTPRFSAFEAEHVQAVARTQRDWYGDAAIIALLEMDKPYIEYLTDVTVVVVRIPSAADPEFVVFAGVQHLAPTSAGLKRLYLRGASVMPEPIDSELLPRFAP